MASISETGHAKNVANFMQLVSFVNDYGAAYNPTRNSIKLPNLQTQAKTAEEALVAVNLALANYNNAITDREAAFAPLAKLATRITSALKATDATKQIIETMVSLNKKLQGSRVSAVLTEDEQLARKAENKSAKQISASQQSYDNRLDTFNKMVNLLESIPQYYPNEVALKAASLLALYNTLKTHNAMVVSTGTLLSNARVKRDLLLYDAETGLPATTQDVKNYVKSVFGATNIAYTQMASLAIKGIPL